MNFGVHLIDYLSYRLYRLLNLIPLLTGYWFKLIFHINQNRRTGYRCSMASRIHLPQKNGFAVIVANNADSRQMSSCLVYLKKALASVDEPNEIIVADTDMETNPEMIRLGLPNLKIVRSEKKKDGLTFLAKALESTPYEWVYTLSADIQVTAATFVNILKFRRPNVFAIGSNIVSATLDRNQNRTGWTGFQSEHGSAEFICLKPKTSGLARGNLFADTNAALFQRKILLNLLINRQPGLFDAITTDALNYISVEWCLTSWQNGFEVLFCPQSLVHESVGTRQRLIAHDENRLHRQIKHKLLFDLAHPWHCGTNLGTLKHILRLDTLLTKELCRLTVLGALCISQFRQAMSPFPLRRFDDLVQKYYAPVENNEQAKPTIIVVTPFCVIPPFHGGAVRIYNLIKRLSSHYRVVLLSDEGMLYRAHEVEEYMGGLLSLHLIPHRPKETAKDRTDRTRRIEHHSHPALKNELKRLMTSYNASLVLVEYIELSACQKMKPHGLPFVLSIHDVLLTPGDTGQKRHDAYERKMIAGFDDAFVCSEEDAALLDHNVQVVANGIDADTINYKSSVGNTRILFAGPFRCATNWEGIQRFLKNVYPQLVEEIPEIKMIIIGGAGADSISRTFPIFNQSGIQVIERVKDIRGLLDSCALTINPMVELRGSSLKLIESLAAGRVCISTHAGARGYLSAGFPGLISVETIEDFSGPLKRILTDESYRLSIEAPDLNRLKPFTWQHSGEKLYQIINSHINSAKPIAST